MRNREEPTLAIVMAIVLPGLFMAVPGDVMAQAVQGRTVSSSASQGMAAIDAAAKDGKYLYIFFWKTNDKQSQTMHEVFQSAMNKWAKSTNSVGIQLADPRERPVVDKFGVSRAPMPLVLALAPNGAVTKGFPIKFDENQLLEGFVSPCTAKCLKCLQDRKLVLLCIQNEKTQFSQVAMTAALNFKADARFATATEIVTLNPEDTAEAAFLRDLKVDPRTSQAVTVVLAPPGQSVASFVGAVTKDQIIAKVQAGPCADGQCGPSGCCP